MDEWAGRRRDGVLAAHKLVMLGPKYSSGYITCDLVDDLQYHRFDLVFSRRSGGNTARIDMYDDGASNFNVRLLKKEVKGSAGLAISLIPDDGETLNDGAMDDGGFWTYSVMTGPSTDNDPAKMTVYLRLLDQDGVLRLDTSSK